MFGRGNFRSHDNFCVPDKESRRRAQEENNYDWFAREENGGMVLESIRRLGREKKIHE